jgi:hypothetical protein
MKEEPRFQGSIRQRRKNCEQQRIGFSVNFDGYFRPDDDLPLPPGEHPEGLHPVRRL